MTAGHVRRGHLRRWRIPVVLWAALGLTVASGGTAFAYFSSTGTGSGEAPIGTLTTLEVQHASTGVATLMPGLPGNVRFTVTNPNGVTVSLTELSAIEQVTSTTEEACPAAELKPVRTPYRLPAPIVVAAGASTGNLSLTVVKLTSNARTKCQGRTFTVTLLFSGATS
jgi:hypothetical protein